MDIILTTTDNPYNPTEQWLQWLAFDQDAGHYTNEKIARLSNSVDITDEDELEFLYVQACLFILEHDPEGIYTLITAPEDTPE